MDNKFITNKEFKVFKLNSRGLGQLDIITETLDDALFILSTICPEGREFSIVKTRMEEAGMYARRSVSLDPKNQVE